MQWKILQFKTPDDFVISTGKQYSVKFFVEQCCKFLGIIIKWKGRGVNEVGYIYNLNKLKNPKLKKGMIIIRIDKKYFRPLDVDNLIGDSRKAQRLLNWKPKTTIYDLISRMMKSDLNSIKKNL